MAKQPITDTSPLIFSNKPHASYEALIAIPSCDEFPNIKDVFSSLEANDPKLLEKTLLVINVNNRTKSPSVNNTRTIEWLKSYSGRLQTVHLNSTEPPYSYPEKFGVGLARHQAVMAGLEYISNNAPVISLDGDSPVNENYLEAIFTYIEGNPEFGAGHVNFKHRLEGTEKENRAIQLYDEHLHRHRKGLEDAGSPHAWYAIGSTIVCTKEAYLKSGGYNPRRMAGEDFYLLQQLSKVGYKIEMIEEAFVYPSNRQSDRVPFGTGKAVTDIVESGEWKTYNPLCYKALNRFLDTVYTHLNSNSEHIISESPQEVLPWLKERKFSEVWAKLLQNNKTEEKMKQSFDSWLDAFQTLKLIHFLTESYFQKVNIEL